MLVPTLLRGRRLPARAACSVVNGDHVEERIVTTGQSVGDLIEITNGLKAGERVATEERRAAHRRCDDYKELQNLELNLRTLP